MGWLIKGKKYLLGLLIILFNGVAFASIKTVSSEFMNKAQIGSDGPKLVQVDLEGQTRYFLTYTLKDKESEMAVLDEKEFSAIRNDMKKILDRARVYSIKRGTKRGVCKNEIVYTKVDENKNVINEPFCLNQMSSKNRLAVREWFRTLYKKVN